MNNQLFKKRAGTLIERYICDKYNLFFNKQQIKKGYYDAYDKDFIYEIKAAYINNSSRFIINKHNHTQLNNVGGKYIFVTYNLIDNDKGLQLITDINIKKILFLKSYIVNKIIATKKTELFTNKNKKREYIRIGVNSIFKIGGSND